MEKRAFLAIILSLAILILWQSGFNKHYPIVNKEVKTENAPADIRKNSLFVEKTGDRLARLTDKESTGKAETESVELTIIETEKVKMDFSNPGAVIKKIYFKDFNLTLNINNGMFLHSMDGDYTFKKSSNSFVFASAENGHSVQKTLSFGVVPYGTRLEVIYKNDSATPWKFNEQIDIADIVDASKSVDSRFYEVVVFGSGVASRKNPSRVKQELILPYDNKSLAFRDRYSCVVIEPEGVNNKSQYYMYNNNNEVRVGYNIEDIVIPVNSQQSFSYIFYMGPQDVKALEKLGYQDVVNFGSFDIISSMLLSIMRFFYRVFHSWGLSVILLSCFVFICLYPLTLKQMNAMKQTQMLQPQIEALRKTYKDNPQRLNKEIMELYKTHKVNPFGGCLPLILQIPIFFGLYQALYRSVELKGAHFLWIKDLAEPDRLITMSNSLPFIGNEINLLPVLMGVAMFFQQKISMKASASSGASLEQQKMMIVIFPVMFLFLFYKFPSGLNLYWFLSTTLTTLSQWRKVGVAA